MTAWPTSLPQSPLRDGYEETMTSATLRTETEVGPAKLRRRYRSSPIHHKMRFIMDESQLNTLETFYKTDTVGGALEFTMPHPIKNTTMTVRFLEDRPYSVTYYGSKYMVEMTLEQIA